MTFRKNVVLMYFNVLLCTFAYLVLLCLPARAQTQFSGQITSNTSAPVTLANPVYYNETITAVGVSTTGALSCAAYPQVTFFYTRAGVFCEMSVLEWLRLAGYGVSFPNATPKSFTLTVF
jgi:hypothetical protein